MKVEISRSLYFKPTNLSIKLVGTISLPSVPIKGMSLVTPQIDDDHKPLPYSAFTEEDDQGSPVQIKDVILVNQKPGIFRYCASLETGEFGGFFSGCLFIASIIDFFHCTQPGSAMWYFSDLFEDYNEFFVEGGWEKCTGYKLDIESDFFKDLEAHVSENEVKP